MAPEEYFEDHWTIPSYFSQSAPVEARERINYSHIVFN